jgi:hypothetical protein
LSAAALRGVPLVAMIAASVPEYMIYMLDGRYLG